MGKNSPAISTQVKDTKGTEDKGDDTNVANGGPPAIGPRSTTPPTLTGATTDVTPAAR